MKTTLSCCIILLTSIYATCNKNHDCKQATYAFEAFYKAYPDKDSVRINDTIWLELNTPTQLKDVMSNAIVDYSDAANLGTAISFLEFVGGNFSDPGAVPSANDFDNVLIYGETIKPLNTKQVREYNFIEKNGTYLFKVGIVPKKKGLFAFGPGSAANVFRKNDKCTKADFNLTFKNTDQHLYLYEQSRPGYVISDYERQHMYCFKVY